MLGFLFWVFFWGGDVLYLLLSPPAGQCMLMKIREFTFKDRLKVFKTNCIFSIYFYTKIWISIDRILVIPLSIVSKGQILYLCCDSCFSCVWGEGEIQAIFPPAFTANCMFSPPSVHLSFYFLFFFFFVFLPSDLVVGVCRRAATALVRTSNFSATSSSRASSFKQDSRLLKRGRESGGEKTKA